MVRVSIVGIIMCLCAVARATEPFFTSSVLITTDTNVSAKRVAEGLARSATIIDVYDNYVIAKIEINKRSLLEKVAHTAGVVKVERGIRVGYKAAVVCGSSSQSLGADFEDEMKCLGALSCTPSGTTRLWAQESIASDLAQKYLAENKIPRVTKIGVVDSGFDKTLDAQMNGQNFSVKPGLTSVTQPHEDSVGHGSRVASLIKGLDGIGASTNSPLTMYSINKGEGISSAEVGNALLRACRDGNGHVRSVVEI